MTALCSGRALTGQDLWTSDVVAEREAAKLICDRCTVAADCLRGALARGEKWGVWAGMDLGAVDMAEPVAFVRPAVYAPQHGSRAAYMRCHDGEGGKACPECTAANSAYIAQRRLEEKFSPKPKRRKKHEGQVSLLEIAPVTAGLRMGV